jgi:hypothetical protein
MTPSDVPYIIIDKLCHASIQKLTDSRYCRSAVPACEHQLGKQPVAYQLIGPSNQTCL